jgi:hypothetical protein
MFKRQLSCFRRRVSCVRVEFPVMASSLKFRLRILSIGAVKSSGVAFKVKTSSFGYQFQAKHVLYVWGGRTNQKQ